MTCVADEHGVWVAICFSLFSVHLTLYCVLDETRLTSHGDLLTFLELFKRLRKEIFKNIYILYKTKNSINCVVLPRSWFYIVY